MIIFSHKCGQLGNRLFAFAHLIAYAAANNKKIVNLSFDEYAIHFDKPSSDVLCRYPFKAGIRSSAIRSWLFLLNKIVLKVLRLARINNSPFHSIVVADLPDYQFSDDRYFDLTKNLSVSERKEKPVIFMFGRFFRDYGNFAKYQNIIREHFKPILKIQEEVDNYISNIRTKATTVVGVHIRAGDYAHFADGKYFFSQESYSSKILELINAHSERIFFFVICSNAPIDLTIFRELPCATGIGHLVGDMYSFSQCDYIMGPPSTYTLWASFYGNKPLYQIRDINEPVTLDKFRILPPEILFNFSFN